MKSNGPITREERGEQWMEGGNRIGDDQTTTERLKLYSECKDYTAKQGDERATLVSREETFTRRQYNDLNFVLTRILSRK